MKRMTAPYPPWHFWYDDAQNSFAPAGPDEESGGGSPSGEPVGRVVLDGGSIALDHSGYEVPENHWTA